MEEREAVRLSAREAERLRGHCQHFSRLGWALFGQMLAMLAVPAVAGAVVGLLAPELLENSIFLWGLSVLSAYGVGVPVFWLIIRGAPAAPTPIPRRPLGPARFGQVYLIGLAALYLCNYATLALLWVVGQLRGAPVTNPVDSIVDYPVALTLVLGCVIAPLGEEFMFRRLLLDRLRPYGDGFAALASALCFGLFHGNLNQFFYAVALGAIFAYVVLRTGCLWQTILLHAMVNFISSGLLPLSEQFGAAGETALSLFVVGAILLGVVFFLALRRELWFDPGGSGFSEGRKWRLFLENPGMVFSCLLAALIAASYLFFL